MQSNRQTYWWEGDLNYMDHTNYIKAIIDNEQSAVQNNKDLIGLVMDEGMDSEFRDLEYSKKDDDLISNINRLFDEKEKDEEKYQEGESFEALVQQGINAGQAWANRYAPQPFNPNADVVDPGFASNLDYLAEASERQVNSTFKPTFGRPKLSSNRRSAPAAR